MGLQISFRSALHKNYNSQTISFELLPLLSYLNMEFETLLYNIKKKLYTVKVKEFLSLLNII